MSTRLSWKFALGVVATFQLTLGASAQEPAATAAATEAAVPAPVLTKADPALLAAAIQTDQITIPTPGELFEAIGNTGTPNWTSQYRSPIPTAFSNRAQMALNVGGLIADGYIAIEGQDSQQVKNVGKDIITLARALAVSDQVLSRGNSITEFAENNEWMALKEELDATQDEVKLAMEERKDQDLITLVSLGGWIRGTQAVSGLLLNEYTPDTAKIIRQPALVSYIRQKISTLPEKIQSEELVKTINTELIELEKILSLPPDQAPSREQIKTIHEKTTALIQAISTKK